MEARYIMDMHNSYLILEGKGNGSESFLTKMILYNNILGLLQVELRSIDDKDYFYYNTTSKESLFNIYENQLIGYDRLKTLLLDIIEILESSGDYLLEEGRFVLKPQYIYIDQREQKPRLCYYVDYNEPLLEQFSGLLEYFMNKVDYKDEKAVLLVYALYKTTKECNTTFDQLKAELQKDIDNSKQENKGNTSNYDYSTNDKDEDNMIKNNINKDNSQNEIQSNYKMEDKIKSRNESSYDLTQHDNTTYMSEVSDEKEGLVFEKSSYIIGILSVIAISIIFIASFKSKLLYNSFGTQIDIVKLVCLIIIMACIEGLVLSKVFHKDRRVAKAVEREKFELDNDKPELKNEDNFHTQMLWDEFDDEEEDNHTVLLSGLNANMNTYYLEAVDNIENIYIDTVPFVVGKNSNGVNYRIDENTVSRFHARITVNEDKIDITDLGSTNGTYINGVSIEKHIPYNLSLNDEICLARCKYILKES